ncbi:MAG: hypothetical protein ACYC0C_01440 [Devosia sp.]
MFLLLPALVSAGILIATLALIFGRRRSWRTVGIATLAAVGVLSLVALGLVFNLFWIQSLLDGYANKIGDVAGLSPPLVKSLALAALVPVLILIGWAISFSRTKRRFGLIALVGLAAAYFGALAFLTLDQRVSRTGDALQCYVVTAVGVTWRDIQYQGIDPSTGRQCEPAKPYLLPTLARLDELLRAGRSLEPIQPNGRFFSTVGDPIVWHHREADGSLTFFDAPGFDPITGDRLEPITKSIVREWQELQAKQAAADAARLADQERERLEAEKQQVALAAKAQEAEHARAQEAALRQDQESARLEAERQQAALAAKAQEAEDARTQEATRLEYMRSLVIVDPEHDPASVGFAFAPARPKNDLDALAAQLLPQAFAKVAPTSVSVVPTLFGSKFQTDGYFDAAMSGDLQPIEESDALSHVNRIVLGTVKVDCGSNPAAADLTNCAVVMSFVILGVGPIQVAAGRLDDIGPGISEHAAIVRGIELLAERSNAQIFGDNRSGQ